MYAIPLPTFRIIEVRKEKQLVLREVEEEKGLNSTLRKNIDEFKAKMEK